MAMTVYTIFRSVLVHTSTQVCSSLYMVCCSLYSLYSLYSLELGFYARLLTPFPHPFLLAPTFLTLASFSFLFLFLSLLLFLPPSQSHLYNMYHKSINLHIYQLLFMHYLFSSPKIPHVHHAWYNQMNENKIYKCCDTQVFLNKIYLKTQSNSN